MKIAIVASGHIPSEWAHSINTVKHAQGFKDLNKKYTVEIHTPIRLFEYLKLKKIKSINDFYNVDDNIKIYTYVDLTYFFLELKPFSYIYYLTNKILKGKLVYIFDIERKIANNIKKKKYNLVYARTRRCAEYLIKNKIPTIIEMHGPNTTNPEVKNLFKLAKSNYFLGISTISEILKTKYKDAGIPNKKLIVQEDAVDLKKFDNIKQNKTQLKNKLNLNNNYQYITYCGSLHSGKGINDLIELANKAKLDNVKFLIIGGPEKQRKKLEKICRNKKIQNIIFLGFIQNSLVPYYLKASDILIMLYNNLEKKTIMDINTTSPIKLFEYMASKTPIIVTKIPTIEKIVTNKEVMLVKMGDYDDIIEKIKELLSNQKLKNRLTRNSYKKTNKYTYKQRCMNIIRFIENEY